MNKKLNKLKKVEQITNSEVTKALQTAKMLAKSDAPVKTGKLKASIVTDLYGKVKSISAEAFYAIYQEFGTRFFRAQPFFYHNVRKSLATAKKNILNKLRK